MGLFGLFSDLDRWCDYFGQNLFLHIITEFWRGCKETEQYRKGELGSNPLTQRGLQ